MRESNLQRQIIQHLRKLGAEVFNQTAKSPDLLVCYKGWFIAIEIKVENRKPTLMQEHQLKRVRQAGGIAGLAYSIEDVEKLLEECSRDTIT